MASIRIESARVEWSPGRPFFGDHAIHHGHELVQVKVLSDRRGEGGGIAMLMRFTPPPGKMIKIIAVARSDEHGFTLIGERSTKFGQRLNTPVDYVLNTEGQSHSAFIASEMIAFVVYTGEPDEVTAMEVLDIEAQS
jgi:hypothetical protein